MSKGHGPLLLTTAPFLLRGVSCNCICIRSGLSAAAAKSKQRGAAQGAGTACDGE